MIEVAPGVFIPIMLVESNNAFIRFLNTTNNIATIKQDNIQTENISDYEIIIQNSNKRKERDSKVINLLKKNFPEQFKPMLTKLCTKYNDIFGLETEAKSTCKFYEQKMNLRDMQPIYIKNYRIPHSHKLEIYNQAKTLIENNIVKPSFSEYNSPNLLVLKKSLPGSHEKRWRLLINNRQIIKKYFSCLDLISCFHQISLSEGSKAEVAVA